MNQIEKWQKQYKENSSHKGGFSDVRLWPCYMVFSGSMFLLAPYLGAFLAFVVVAVPTLVVARKVAEIESRNPENARLFQEFHHKQYVVKPQEAAAKDTKKATKVATSKIKKSDEQEHGLSFAARIAVANN